MQSKTLFIRKFMLNVNYMAIYLQNQFDGAQMKYSSQFHAVISIFVHVEQQFTVLVCSFMDKSV